MSLPEHRQAIDVLDAQIVKLLNERTKHVLEIGALKVKAGQEIYAPQRERAVFQKVTKLNKGPITDAGLRAIYREVMSASLSLEKSLAIAYLGPEATFTHQAALKRFGASLCYVPQKTIADVFHEVSKHRADYGVVPVENSTEGVVTHTLDMFVDSDLKVVSQVVLRISHCFVSRHPRDQIKRIFVHPQTLGQCRNWLQRNFPNAVLRETSSNAESAQFASDEPTDHTIKQGKAGKTKKGEIFDPRMISGQQLLSGAVTSELAAQRYNLPILEHDIQDNAANATRFLVLGHQCPPPSGKGTDRTSLMFSIRDEAGALHRSLAPFRRFRINMTKIESRPSKRKAWEYFFFVDCDGHAEDPKVAKAIAMLGQHCSFVKVLGSYPNSD